MQFTSFQCSSILSHSMKFPSINFNSFNSIQSTLFPAKQVQIIVTQESQGSLHTVTTAIGHVGNNVSERRMGVALQEYEVKTKQLYLKA